MVKVSVIIPIYNGEKYIKDSIQYVINQTFKDIEIIYVNDGSTDNTLQILNDYAKKDDRIKIITQENQYAGIARNNGIKESSGDYILILDSDDIFELNMVEKLYDTIIKDDSDLVVCGWNSYNDYLKKVIRNNKIEDKFINISPFSPIDIKDELFTFSKPNTWTKMFKRELFIKNNLKFEDCKCYNDMTCIHLICALANKISVIKDCLVSYKYNRSDNLTSQWVNNFNCLTYAIKKLEEKLKEFDLYETYKTTFTIRCAKVFAINYVKITKEEQEEIKKEVVKYFPKELCDYITLKYKIPLIKRRKIKLNREKFF